MQVCILDNSQLRRRTISKTWGILCLANLILAGNFDIDCLEVYNVPTATLL